MASKARRYPNALHGLVGLGGPRLNELAKAAGLPLRGVHPSPGARAALLRDGLAEPALLRPHLVAADYDVLGARLRVGGSAGLGEAFADAVFARLFEEVTVPENRLVRSWRDPARAGEWPELRELSVWLGLDERRRRAVAAELGEALEPVGAWGLPRVRDAAGAVWIAIPGGAFAMGLRDGEKRALGRLTQGWSEESRMHAREMGVVARRAHRVELPPFLCAEEPVGRFTGSAAVAFARRAGGRLLTEAEWEYLARDGGAEDFAFAEARMAFGVSGLDWGTWVEDGWHGSYDGAPSDGRAWEPRERPEMVRGGALLSWPWQEEGERLLLHPANRERKGAGEYPVLVARDLPGRSGVSPRRSAWKTTSS